jgi:D-3-phosphoglycerate dehydrogenase / 2-oxoglutarate reductase
MKWKVLITSIHLQKAIDSFHHYFHENGIEVEMPTIVQNLNEEQLLGIIEHFDGIIAGDDELTATVLKAAKRLKVISRWGVGLDAVDLDAAKELGIKVFNTPAVFAEEVADVVIGYMILLARRLHTIDQLIRVGGWQKISGISLTGKSLGVIGIGSIGRAVIKRAKAFGMKIYGNDIRPIDKSFVRKMELHEVSLELLLRNSNFVSLNCNLNPSSRRLIGRRELSWMPHHSFLINTARGGLIDEAALIEKLQSGELAGAAMDVFETEPLPIDNPLRKFENCILGSHNSSNTTEAVMRVNRLSIENLIKGLGKIG